MTTNSTTAILSTVIAPSTRAPIFVPSTSSVVKNATITMGAMSRWNEPIMMFVLKLTPMRRRKSLRYTPQNLEMTEPAMSISRIRSQPMIHAKISPSVAYVNVYAEPATGITDANSA